jgi:hypothetical protein
MRVASGPFPKFELIDEYEAPLLNLQFDDFMAIFSQKKSHRRIHHPQIPKKVPKYKLNQLTGNREDF